MIVALDFDGVLTSLKVDWREVRLKVSSRLGMEVKSLNSFFESSWGTHEFEVANKIAKEYEIIAVEHSPLFSDVIPALQLAAETGASVYITSMQSIDALLKFVREHTLENYFKGIFGREIAANKETQLRIVSQREGIEDRRNIVLFDDRKEIIERCGDLGYRCILFKRKNKYDLKYALSQVLCTKE